MKTAKHITLIYAVILVASVTAVYWPVQEFGFLSYDDSVYVTSNAQLQKGLSIENLRWAMTTTDAGFWHPLTWLSLILDYELYHLNPAGYHWTNLILHLFSTILLFTGLKRMTGGNGKSAFVAALFALHPLHVESVAWISERKDVLSGCLWMLTMNAYAHYAEKPGMFRYGLMTACFISGLMAKPMLVTMPLVLFLLDVWPLKRLSFPRCLANKGWREAASVLKVNGALIAEKVPLLCASAVISITTYETEKHFQALAPSGELSLYDRAATAVVAAVTYLEKMLWPHNLTAFYPHPGSWPVFQVLASGLILIAITLAAFYLARTRPYLVVGWLWYLISLLPVSGIIQIGSHAMADRYTYIPLTGIFVMVVWEGGRIVKFRAGRAITLTVSVAIICTLAFLSSVQLKYWRNDGTLFIHALNVTKKNYLAHSGLGSFLLAEGRPGDGIRHLMKAVSIRPDYNPAWFKMGIYFSRQGQYGEAISCFQTIIGNSPDHQDARGQLGYNMLLAGRLDEAINNLEALVQNRTRDAEIYNYLGIALMKKERYPEALAVFKNALQIKPEHAGIHNNLAMLLMQMGRDMEAIGHFRTALRIQPEYANAHYHLARILTRFGYLRESQEHYREAVRINPEYKNN